MDVIVQVLLGGTSIGLIYALPALAIVLLYNTAGFFNLAQGECLALATYVLYQFFVLWGLPLWISIPATILVLALFGLLINKLLFNPLRKFRAKELYVLITTIALSIFLQNMMRLIWGSKPLAISNVFPSKAINILGANVMPYMFCILGVSAVLLGVLYILLTKTKYGIAMTAASENKDAASLMGVRVDAIIGLSFAISLGITAVSGVLSTSVLYLQPEMGTSVSTKAFAACIIGGFGNPAGAIIGGILLGIVETAVAMVLPASYKDAITFALLILFLLFKPTGLFKTRNSTKV